jgi:hypothetical protein
MVGCVRPGIVRASRTAERREWRDNSARTMSVDNRETLYIQNLIDDLSAVTLYLPQMKMIIKNHTNPPASICPRERTKLCSMWHA